MVSIFAGILFTAHHMHPSSLRHLPRRGRTWHTVISPETRHVLPGLPSLPPAGHGHLSTSYLLLSPVACHFCSHLCCLQHWVQKHTGRHQVLKNVNWKLTLLKSQTASAGNSDFQMQPWVPISTRSQLSGPQQHSVQAERPLWRSLKSFNK